MTQNVRSGAYCIFSKEDSLFWKNDSEGVILRVYSLLKIGIRANVLNHISMRSYWIAQSFLYVPTGHVMSLWKEYLLQKRICRLVGGLRVALQLFQAMRRQKCLSLLIYSAFEAKFQAIFAELHLDPIWSRFR